MGETPIIFENRRAGLSKINRREAIEALWVILKLGLGRIFHASTSRAPDGVMAPQSTRR